MRKRRGSLLQKALAVLLSAVLAAGTLQASAPAHVRAGEVNPVAEPAPQAGNTASGQDWTLAEDGRLTISSDAGMEDWGQNGGKVHGQVQAVEIKDSVTSICSGAFFQCENLTSVTISEDVTRVEAQAFENCYSLERITLPKKVQSIGRAAFSECIKLTEITIPASVTHIGPSAFSGCRDLTEVTLLGTKPPILDKDVFAGCGAVAAGVEGIRVPAGYEDAYKEDSAWVNWAPYIAGGTVEDTDIASGTDWVLATDGRLTVRSDAGMADWCEHRDGQKDKVKEAVIAESVTSIGDNAFKQCSNLTDITMSEDVTTIGAYAFESCSSLERITLPGKVERIGSYAFGGCKLASIELPGEVNSIGSYAFSGCGELTGIELPGSVTSIGEGAFYGCGKLTGIELPEGVTAIGKFVFHSCYSLEDIRIPENVTSIGQSAFYDCRSMTDITIPAGMLGINEKANPPAMLGRIE